MATNKTSLSAGAIIRDMLLNDSEVKKRVKKVFPIVAEKAVLPYVLYRRAGFEQRPTKSGAGGAAGVRMEVICYTADYASGVELAEAVRGALDCKSGERDGLVMRSCVLTDSEEAFEDDAYIQNLIFTLKL